MSGKKTTLKRIIIFCLLAYVPVYFSGALTIEGEGEELTMTSATASFMMMFYPAIANIVTRIITKEGFHNTYLGTGRKCGRYYIISTLLIIASCLAGGLLSASLTLEDWSFGKALASDSTMFVFLFSTGLTNGLSILASGFGEEFGWRAYLTPKLEELMSTPKAVVVTGLIWSFWHAPLIVRGYDFGTDYSFYPYGGLIGMAIFCIAMSATLTWVVKKTGSVYPAAIIHAVIDGLTTAVLAMFFFKDRTTGEKFSPKYCDFVSNCTFMIPSMILGAVFFVMLFQKKKSEN